MVVSFLCLCLSRNNYFDNSETFEILNDTRAINRKVEYLESSICTKDIFLFVTFIFLMCFTGNWKEVNNVCESICLLQSDCQIFDGRAELSCRYKQELNIWNEHLSFYHLKHCYFLFSLCSFFVCACVMRGEKQKRSYIHFVLINCNKIIKSVII